METKKSQHNCKVKSTKPVNNEVKEDYGNFISEQLKQTFKDIAP